MPRCFLGGPLYHVRYSQQPTSVTTGFTSAVEELKVLTQLPLPWTGQGKDTGTRTDKPQWGNASSKPEGGGQQGPALTERALLKNAFEQLTDKCPPSPFQGGSPRILAWTTGAVRVLHHPSCTGLSVFKPSVY